MTKIPPFKEFIYSYTMLDPKSNYSEIVSKKLKISDSCYLSVVPCKIEAHNIM